MFYSDGINHSFRSTIQVIPRTDVEIISFIEGNLKILPEFVNENIIKGNVRLIKDGNIDYFIPIKLEVKTQNMNKDILKGLTYLDRARYNEKILNGTAKFNGNEYTNDIIIGNITSKGMYSNSILNGNLTYNKEQKSTDIYGAAHIDTEDYSRVLLRGNLNIKASKQYWTLLECNDIHIDIGNYQEDILQGNIDFQMGEIIRDIYGKTILEESGFINDNIIDGNASILKENKEIDLLQGTVSIYSHYSAAEFPCRVKVNKKQFIHSIFCKLTVPPNRKYDIPCKIQVEGMNKSETVLLEGSITLLDRDQYSQDILSDNHVIYLPGATVDIDCTAKVNPVYTRKELLYCKINVVDTVEFNILCKVEVEPPADYWFYQEILYTKLIVGIPYEHDIESKVEVKANESGNINTYEYRKYGPRPQSRIVIAVSPTWNYEPFVFKSSLITFLDRYYGKADFSIVFGGSARADFDIMNLAANYKIRRERLLRVPIIVDFKNPMVTANSVDHFIYHMFNFKPEEPKIISRVFLFMNQPSWYYNDPIAKIAEVCIKNQISCVAINGGGEYQEMTKIDRARDEMYNNIEYDRQQRMHPNYGFINVQYKEDPNKITY